MATHSILSVSGAKKWLGCAGAPAMEMGEPDSRSSFADEGTAAHFLAANCLEAELDAKHYQGRFIEVDAHGDCDIVPGSATGFAIDAEMIANVQTYIDYVRMIAAGDGAVLMVEQRVPLGHITGEPNGGGTADAIVLVGDTLHIIDLKYGRGVPVSAWENEQLMLYALGALELLSLSEDIDAISKVVLHIVQPRISDEPNTYETTLPALCDFEERAALAAEQCHKAMADHAEGKDISEYLKPSESACQWCKAKAKCPALADLVQHEIGQQFEDMGAASTDEQVRTFAPSTLAEKMAKVALIEDWCKAVRAKAFEVLQSGEPVPGFKLVKGRAGNRAWSSPEEAEAMLKAMRIKHDLMYDYKVISPTKAEKLAEQELIGKRQWPKLQALITRAEGGLSVAPDSDKRESVQVQVMQFDEVTD